MKRYAICSALAASGVPVLVQARGHHISKVPEFPLVVSADSISKIQKTKAASEMLKRFHAYDDVIRVINSKRHRAGKGTMRNRRTKQRVGPLIIFKERTPMIRAFRNIPGVDLLCVTRLNLLKLAPGGHMGRFIIWTDDAFNYLDALYGTPEKPSKLKRDYQMPKAPMTISDIQRIINSDAIQKVLRPKKKQHHVPARKNPLKNKYLMNKLNPYYAIDKKERAKRDKMLKQKKLMDKVKYKKAVQKKRALERLIKKGKAKAPEKKVYKKPSSEEQKKIMEKRLNFEGLAKKTIRK